MMNSTLTDNQMIQTLQIYGVSASPALCDSIRAYIDLLLRWNKRIALTTVTDPVEILRFHFGESMFAINQVPIRHGRLADVGTGAGFPAVPISMAVPDLHCVLIESNQKKATFLAELVRTLNLDHVEVYRGRMESFDSTSERFDFTISRALGIHLDFLQWSFVHLSAYGSAVLWISDADAVQISKTLPWNWRKPAPIPDSQHRVLLIGSNKS